ncbi:hypothetical protein CYMTET_11796 [Cymbomonas tetramitiformis]|uniref:Uncharacterized protein n=1 Tax=Cymbomonas tetramitiformis TaxID=36881 RepID=A0AAE0LCP7_9CHLO|nr:hypothetical protein CYMTET_11796 [Cymbomonas tetramitiformis]
MQAFKRRIDAFFMRNRQINSGILNGFHPIVKFVDICTEEHFATDWKDHDELVCPGRTGGFFCFRIRRISITSRLFARRGARPLQTPRDFFMNWMAHRQGEPGTVNLTGLGL